MHVYFNIQLLFMKFIYIYLLISKSIIYLSHYRHEVPVTSQPISIVHMDDDIVVVNKPASIPVSCL